MTRVTDKIADPVLVTAMRLTPLQILDATARAQFGVVSWDQLLAIGFTPNQIHDHVARGMLCRIAPRAYRLAGVPESWEQELMTAHLWAGEPSAISGPPAAAFRNLTGFKRNGVEISLFGGKRRPKGLPYAVRRVSGRLIKEIEIIQGIPLTSVRLTLLDLAGRKHPRRERALDDCLFKGLTDLGQMWLLYDQEWSKGRRGIRILREMLVGRTGGKGPTQTDLEDLYLKVVGEFGLPEPERQYPIDLFGEPIQVDFAYPEAKIAIECDSYAWHGDRSAFDRDHKRDQLLRLLGWRVLRFTWAQLMFDPALVAAVVRAELTSSGSSVA